MSHLAVSLFHRLTRSVAMSALCSVVAAFALMAAPAAVAAAGRCATTGPTGGAYSVTLCLTSPATDQSVAGPQTVQATVSVTGPTPPTPGAKLRFYLDGEYVLTDYQAPYLFTLPTDRWTDGAHVLEVEALMKDAFLTPERPSVNLIFANGVSTVAPNTRTFRAATGTPTGGPFVVAVTGDGAGGMTTATNVTNEIARWNPNMLLYLGDVYEKGTPTEFYNWYGTGSQFYSRFRAITNPTIGNHEYENKAAPGYFDYWDNVPHYYSFDAAGWHFISLDSTGQFGQTQPGTAQYEWLVNDLKTSSAACTIAYWHHPLYNVGPEGDSKSMQAIWSLLARNGVDLVLNGHDHDYQRWTPMDEGGTPDPDGMTEMISGAGGHGVQGHVRSDTRLVFGADTSPNAFGALRLELNAQGAAFRYVNTAGTVLDSGSMPCRGMAADASAPTVPTNVAATSSSSVQNMIAWSPASDNVGVTGYDVYRNGAFLATAGPDPRYVDTAISPGTRYDYQVRARDAAGNLSTLSAVAMVTTSSVLFSDGFESGSLAPNWTTGAGTVAIQQQVVDAGAYAARITSTAGTANHAFRDLSPARSEIYARVWFKIVNQPTTTGNSVRLLGLRDSSTTKASLLGVFVSNTGKLGYNNDAASTSTTSTTSVSQGAWHSLQVRAVINGTSGRVDVWLDGAIVSQLSKTENLGTTSVGRIQLGENRTGRVYDVALDEVVLDGKFIDMTDSQAPTTPTDLAVVTNAATHLDIAWAAATDNVAVVGYDVYRNSSLAASVGVVATFSDTTVNPGVEYEYRIRARDAAGNVSPFSAPAKATTPADAVPPTITLTSPVSSSVLSGSVSLAADANDDVSIHEVEFFVNGTEVGESEEAPYSIVWDSSSFPDGVVTVTAIAEDFSGNTTTSAPVSAVVDNGAPDTVISSGPTGTVNVASATFGFSSTEAGSTFRCALDGATATACTSPKTYTGLASGPHTVTVTAIDAAGTADPTPATREWSVDPSTPLFSDRFESGSLSPTWTNQAAGLTIQQQTVLAGAYAARAVSSGGSGSWAYTQLPATHADLYYRAWVNIVSRGSNVTLMRFRTATGGAIAGIFVSSTGKLGYTNDTSAGGSTTSTSSVTAGWHSLQVRLTIAGATGHIQVWLDGVSIGSLDKAADFGTTSIGRLQLGDSNTGRVYDVAFDDVAAAAGYVQTSTIPFTTINSGPLGLVDSSSATFQFSSMSETATFACSLDDGTFTSCSSPATYSGLADGTHAIRIRAVDPTGVTEDPPASRSWTVDTTPPSVSQTTPADGATDVPDVVSITAAFSEPMASGSISTSTFTLLGPASEAIPATVTYDGAARTATLRPSSPLAAGSRYAVTLTSGATGPTDIAGNGLTSDVAWSFVTGASDSTAPSTPAGLRATTATSGRVDLEWTAASDDVAVVGYDVLRDGTLVAPLGDRTTYSDTTVAPDSTYSYTVRARDAAGNVSGLAVAVIVTTPRALFSDRFESGRLSPTWTNQAAGVTIQQQLVLAGAYAARATAAGGSGSWAYTQLAATHDDLYYRTWFNIASHTGNVNLVRFRTAAGGAIAGVFVSGTGKLGYVNDTTASSITSTSFVSGGWHMLQVHLTVAGGTGRIEVWLDGNRVSALDKGDTFGTAPIGRLQLGDSNTGRVYDVAFDDVAAAAAYINTGDVERPSQPTNVIATTDTHAAVDVSWDHSTDGVGVTGYNVYRDGALLERLAAVTDYRDTSVAPATSYSYAVRARDAAENLSDAGIASPSPITTPADATPPTVTLVAPGDAASVRGTVTLAATAADDFGVARVDFLVDGVVVATDDTTPYIASWDSSGTTDGPAMLAARATDPFGNATTSNGVRVTVDNTPPQTTILGGPTGSVSSTPAEFTFSADEAGASFQCSLDFAAFASCTSPAAYGSLADGTHQFRVRAVDIAGNLDASPATAAWTLDTTPPDTAIESGPAGTVGTDAASFTFALTQPETGATFACSLDAEPFSTCTSPQAYSGLAEGAHTFAVTASDALGNADPTAATWSWTIDVSAPETTITSGPADGSSANSVSTTFHVSASESASTFGCSIDAGAYQLCTSPVTYDALAEGSHTFAVRATDPFGNIDPSPAGRSWNIDVAAPETAITSGPAASANVTTATFTFTSSEEFSTFMCSRDGAAFSTCTSPKTYSALGAGPHTFSVRARDAAGNLDASPASTTWTIDVVAPTIRATSPTNHATDVPLASDVTATFSEPMDASTVSAASFTLVPSGSTAPIAATVSYDPTTDLATLHPIAPLAYGTMYTATVDNGSGGASDLAGNRLAAAAVWTFATIADTTPPETTITSAPPAANSGKATFSFASSEVNSTFICSLDDAASGPCTSPRSYNRLTEGSHVFVVRAIDAAGNTDSTPAQIAWTIDTVAPAVTSTFPAVNATGVAVSSDVRAEFSEILDPSTVTTGTFTLVRQGQTTPASATISFDATTKTARLVPDASLVAAMYTATIKGGTGGVADLAGNRLASDKIWSFTTVGVDTTAPTVSVTAPSGGARVRGAVTISATATDDVAVSQVDFLVNGTAAGSDTTAPYSIAWASTTIADGPASIVARAIDTSDNRSTSAARDVIVDNTSPDTSITSGPAAASFTSSTSATFGFTSTETGGTFECRREGGTFTPCSSPVSYTGLAAGPQTFDVRAIDAAGNTDTTPASRTWTIDTVAPTVSITSPASAASVTGRVTIAANATDNVGVVVVRFYADGILIGSDTSAPYSVSWNTNQVSKGSHTLYAEADDAAGSTTRSANRGVTVN